jgi:hypothetical protein
MPSLNQVATKRCIMQDYNCYIMVAIIWKKIEACAKYLNLKEKYCFDNVLHNIKIDR